MKLDEWIIKPLARSWNLTPNDSDIPFATGLAQDAGSKSSISMGYRDTATSKYRGTIRAKFERLNLSMLFLNVPPVIEAYGIDNLHSLLPILAEKYGIYITTSDVINVTFDKWALPRVVKIQAAGSSTMYEGSVDLQVNIKTMDLADIIKQDIDYDAIVDKYPRTNPKMVYQLKYYGFDFTEFRDEIIKYNVGYAYGQGTCDVIERLNSDVVRNETDGPVFMWYIADTGHCAYLMSCIFKGLTVDYPDANPAYKYVSVWKPGRLDEPQARGTGVLLLHYD